MSTHPDEAKKIHREHNSRMKGVLRSDTATLEQKMYVCAERGQLEAIKTLVARGANATSGLGLAMALARAAELGHLEIIKYFIDEKGASPDIEGVIGTPFTQACFTGHLAIACLKKAQIPTMPFPTTP